jgi:hypothetical protein
MTPSPNKAKAKRKFSSFSRDEALRRLNLSRFEPWEPQVLPLQLSDFFRERLQRLETFDLVVSERARELLIDAICEELLVRHPQLKAWKEAALETDELNGYADYLIAARQELLDIPLLCVVEAKRDNFVKGEAQCLVEMEACAWNNRGAGHSFVVHGMVSNGDIWTCYRLDPDGTVAKTPPYSRADLGHLLGVLDSIFDCCAQLLLGLASTID